MSENVLFPQPENTPPSEMTPVGSRPESIDTASDTTTTPTIDASKVVEDITALPDPTQAVSSAEAPALAESSQVGGGTDHPENLEAELFAPK